MTRWLFAFVAALFLLTITAPIKGWAESESKMTAAQIADGQAKAQIANALVILGRSAKDPDMLMVAAKLLSSVGANVADPKAAPTNGKPTFYDVSKLVEEAKSYAANRSSEAITPVPRQGFCHYEYLCDSLSCSYVWVC